MGQLLNMLVQAIPAGRLDRVASSRDALEGGNHTGVEHSAARGQQSAVGHLAEPVMREIESLAYAVKDVRSHQRLHGGGGVRFPDVGCPSQQSKLKVASDHGRRREQVLTRVAQPLKPAENQLSNLLGHRRKIGKAGSSRGVERLAQTLDDHEGVPFTEGPDAVFKPREGRLVGPAAFSQVPDQHSRVFPREWRQGEPDQPLLLRELGKHPTDSGRAVELFLADGADEEDPTALETASEKRKEAD